MATDKSPDKDNKPKVDQYEGILNSHQTFPNIGLMEAVNGMVVLRGRNGQRDVLFPVPRAVDRYYATMDVVHKYAMMGVAGWDTLKDIADDLRYRICEACEQLTKLNQPVPEEAKVFMYKDIKTPVQEPLSSSTKSAE